MKTRFGLLGIGIVIGVALMLVGWQIVQQSYRYQGSLIENPQPAPDFELTDQRGNSFPLSEQRGRLVLMFFGYTNCPDVCPLTLAEYREIKSQLGEQASQVEFVFITVDPERDTPARMNDYVSSFDPTFVGLSGEMADLEKVWSDYWVYRAKVETGSASGYAMDHTARMYLVDANGNLRLTYPYGFEVEKIVSDLRHMLREADKR
jgi:protein SCO1/2